MILLTSERALVSVSPPVSLRSMHRVQLSGIALRLLAVLVILVTAVLPLPRKESWLNWGASISMPTMIRAAA